MLVWRDGRMPVSFSRIRSHRLLHSERRGGGLWYIGRQGVELKVFWPVLSGMVVLR